MERDYEILAEEALIAGHYVDQTLEETRPWGAHGGRRGRRARIVLNPGLPDERILRGVVHPRFPFIPPDDLARWRANARRALSCCS